jgi:hypothetical protein
MERRKLNRIPIDLPNIQVLAYFGDLGRGDVVCGAPNALCAVVLDLCLADWWERGRAVFCICVSAYLVC